MKMSRLPRGFLKSAVNNGKTGAWFAGLGKPGEPPLSSG